ncbi:hypothetical protein AF332_17410 [Sporosarcina globispora]|uniref:Uncharacterized protein n=1 Tax=Sporosarcina globispora TaxID=1459 RepID=A0A0M0GG49_SPOGL|nr:hypothetical protein AF332_17410 [Sporosarcina globispora]
MFKICSRFVFKPQNLAIKLFVENDALSKLVTLISLPLLSQLFTIAYVNIIYTVITMLNKGLEDVYVFRQYIFFAFL